MQNCAHFLLRPPHKQYSPHVLDQAVEDFRTGKFNSIRACARHHGVPMTTLHYRVKLKVKNAEVCIMSDLFILIHSHNTLHVPFS